MTKLTTCPCCHGEKTMKVFEPTSSFEMMHRYTIERCCHCQGRGTVPVEIEIEAESEHARE
jgi:hypothetical protein